MSILYRRTLTATRVPVTSRIFFNSFSVSTYTGKWPLVKVRSQFIEYFRNNHKHVNIQSSPCVPNSDPTLLFANAGMNQFKPIFIGTVDPSSPLSALDRVVNSQKCIRAGGKHNDLDDVGKDTYHHTFFEMLGTWSFGNYFKTEAVDWAYDILVHTYGLDPNRLYASYFAGDEALGLPCDTEARDLWLKYLPANRVLPFDKKANFWEMGETGPCGPCSEIHFDRIGDRDASALVNADDPDVIEIWNLVFIQYNREADGSLRQLPKKHIDTGMGLERLTSILQEQRSNYDTDAFTPLFQAIQRVVGCAPYTGKIGIEDAAQNYKDTAYRVIADHLRTISFAVADGATPSKEGRGYVLRRILRRAVRYGIQILGAQPGFFAQLIPEVSTAMGETYPELREKLPHVLEIVREEESAFAALLEKGAKYFNKVADDVVSRGATVIDGESVFNLYDESGFPVDLTQIMAAERGLTVDMAGFGQAMQRQKERSREEGKTKRRMGRTVLELGTADMDHLHRQGVALTDDSAKYRLDVAVNTEVEAAFTPRGLVGEGGGEVLDGDTVGLVLRQTPFYAESGGQVADLGQLLVALPNKEEVVLQVVDVQSYGGYILHTCVLDDCSSSRLSALSALQPSAKVQAWVNYKRRRLVAPNHTMTHVLNLALRKVLGVAVDQKGSLVTDEKLRFDFGMNRALTVQELESTEKLVNDAIRSKLAVSSDVVPLATASKVAGLRAVFGDQYPDPVRVVSIGAKVPDLVADPQSSEWLNHSVEFCGGTHITNTAEALAFVLTEETSVAKGVRRVSGVTGHCALEARKSAEALGLEAQALTTRLDKGTDLHALGNDILQLLKVLDDPSTVVAHTVKTALKSSLEALRGEAHVRRTKQQMEALNTKMVDVLESVGRLESEGVRRAVLVLDVGTDSKVLKKVVDDVKKAAPSLSFVCLCKDAASNEIAVVVSVTTDAQQSGLSANTWLSSVLSSTSTGKGGGSPKFATGKISGEESVDEQNLVQTASNFKL